MSVSPPNAPPRQSRRQGQRIKRPLAVYNLCLELDDGKMLGAVSAFAADGLRILSAVDAFVSRPICVCLHALACLLIALEHRRKQGECRERRAQAALSSETCLKVGQTVLDMLSFAL